jgi:hypothetical protein
VNALIDHLLALGFPGRGARGIERFIDQKTAKALGLEVPSVDHG